MAASLNLDDIAAGVTRTEVHVGLQADGMPFAMPVVVVKGREQGPVLWIDAAMHGDETGGVKAAQDFVATLAPDQVGGTIVVACITNPSAYYAGARKSPIDAVDMNRILPGDPEGSFSFQLAADYLQLVRSQATHYINLHCGATPNVVPFYAIHRALQSEAGEIAQGMARSAGAPIVWRSADTWLDHSLFAVLQAAGIPAIIMESGGAARIPDDAVLPLVRALRNVACYLGLLEGPVSSPPPAIDVVAAEPMYASHGGLFVSERKAGDLLAYGDPIGTVRSAFGDVLETLVCHVEKGILLSLRTYAATPSGSQLCELGVVNRSQEVET